MTRLRTDPEPDDRPNEPPAPAPADPDGRERVRAGAMFDQIVRQAHQPRPAPPFQRKPWLPPEQEPFVVVGVFGLTRVVVTLFGPVSDARAAQALADANHRAYQLSPPIPHRPARSAWEPPT